MLRYRKEPRNTRNDTEKCNEEVQEFNAGGQQFDLWLNGIFFRVIRVFRGSPFFYTTKTQSLLVLPFGDPRVLRALLPVLQLCLQLFERFTVGGIVREVLHFVRIGVEVV